MVGSLKLTNSKVNVEKLLEISRLTPKTAMTVARKGVIFLGVEDWITVAKQALVPSPYAIFWKRLALEYPDLLLTKQLPLFFNVIEKHPTLIEQARALLFNLTSRKLPRVEVLKELPVRTEEQRRIKNLLIEKKQSGNQIFYINYFLSNVNKLGEEKADFYLEDGKYVKQFVSKFLFERWCIRENRIKTTYGPATLVSVDRDSSEGTVFYFLPDGSSGVKKLNFLDYSNINLAHAVSIRV